GVDQGAAEVRLGEPVHEQPRFPEVPGERATGAAGGVLRARIAEAITPSASCPVAFPTFTFVRGTVMPEIEKYADAYYSMVWYGPKGYPEHLNSGRCYITGMLGMLRYYGETDVLFADGTSGDGFSFRWCPAWGAPAFN